MKVFISGSQKCGASTFAWLLSQSFENHAVQTMVVGKCAATRLQEVFGLSADAPHFEAPESQVDFASDAFGASALPLDAAARQRFVILDEKTNLNAFAKNLTTANNEFAIIPAYGENIEGADVVVCVVEPTGASVAAYDKIRKECSAKNTPMVLVFNKFDANDPKPVFADASAAISTDSAIAKHWWAGVTEKNRRQLTRLTNKLVAMQTVNA